MLDCQPKTPRWVAPVFAAVLATGASIAAPLPGYAMTVLQVDLKQLVTTADLVVHGSVTRTQVLDRRKDDRGVWTEFTLSVREVWKGDAVKAGGSLTWRHVGGTTADGMTVAVPGMPTFAPGEDVVVVLEKTSDSWVISGGPQGKFSIQKDKAGRATVRRDLLDAHMVQRDATGRLVTAPQPTKMTLSLKDFRAEVLRYVADAAKTPKAAAPKVRGSLAP